MKTLAILCLLFQSAEIFPVTAKEEPVKQTRREWYLVSEPWCSACPAAKRRFLDKGWPKENILSLAECQAKFGFQPDHVPFEFGDPNWKQTLSAEPAKSPGVPKLFGRIGTSHESRQTLVDHLLNDSIHKGRHTSAELEALTDQQLSDLHDKEHNTASGTSSTTHWTIQPQRVQTVRRKRGLFFRW